MKKIVSLTIFLSCLLLIGCQSTNPTSTQQPHAATLENIQNIPSPDLSVAASAGTSESDRVAYFGAMDLKDKTYCDKIANQELKNTCHSELDGFQLTQKAIQDLDAKGCEQITSEDKRKACNISVEIAVQKSKASEEAKADITKSDEILMSGDFQRCSQELKSAEMVNYCEYNIIVNQALEAKDVEKCKEIKDEKYRTLCEDTYKAAAPQS